MKDYIRGLTERIIDRLSVSTETDAKLVDKEGILLNEGIDLLAGFKTIRDTETRLLLGKLVHAIAECHGNVPPPQS